MRESAFFFRKFLKNPKKVGSIYPSSRFLARAMMRMLPFDRLKTILELGGGTGAITREIARGKKKDALLVVFEPDEEFAEILENKFPRALNIRIAKERADNLGITLRKLKLPRPDCVVSSLPFGILGQDVSKKILKEIHASLSADGLFVLYQYKISILPFLLKHFEIRKFSFVPLNLPPALVFLCSPRA